jgi:hypothetical protein
MGQPLRQGIALFSVRLEFGEAQVGRHHRKGGVHNGQIVCASILGIDAIATPRGYIRILKQKKTLSSS